MAEQRIEQGITDTVAGWTVPAGFVQTVAEYPDRTALRWRDAEGAWQSLTYAEYGARVATMAAGYRSLGIGPGQRIVLMMRNIADFHIADVAAYFCGATAISIYNSSAPDQVEYLLNHSEAVLAVVEDDSFLARFTPVRHRLDKLEHIVVLRASEPLSAGVRSVDDLVAGVEPIDLEEAAAAVSSDDLATVIYTSGTTGNPKGVMLTHGDIAWTSESLRRCLDRTREQLVGSRLISYLPMAHVAERMTSHYQSLFFGYEVASCPDPAQLADYLREIRPQILFGVPRVWEKLQAGVLAALAADPERKAQFEAGVAAGIPIAEALDWDRATDEQRETWKFLDAVAFGQVRGLLGVDACKFAITGGAPIRPELLEWFRGIGVPLTEVYGMSESCGPMAWAARRIKAGTVGPAIPGTELRLADDGEVLSRGGNVFQGYLKNPEQTAETLDEDGWLHSGDIGVLDDDGYLRIVDRKKELIITAGGKNLSPANLEAALLNIDLVGQAIAIGDNRPFVSALVVLDPEVAPAWAKQQGIGFSSLADLARNQTVVDSITGQLDAVMAGFNSAERVKKITVIGEEWLPDSDLLTPTMKLKRRGIHARYADAIEGMYSR